MIGILGLTAAALLAAIGTVITDPGPTKAAIDSAFDEPLARDELEREINDAIHDTMVNESMLMAGDEVGIDVEAEAAAVATELLDDLAFRAALHDLIDEVHHRMFVEPTSEPLDATELTNSMVAMAEARTTGLSMVLADDPEVVSIDASSIPDLSAPVALLDQVVLAALALGAALPLAYLVHSHRHRVLTWVGRWLLTFGLFMAVTAVGLPYLAGYVTGWSTVEAAVRSVGLRLLAPAVVAGVVGLGLSSLGSVTKNRERRRNIDDGMTAALGVHEPPAPEAFRPLDLAQRGMADGSRQLTSI